MIKVQSLIQDGNSLIPVEVELALWPGLPSIHFLGLADQHLKESAMRIKSAIKHSGFQFPVAQQILVNLRPSYLKKTSQGLELAVAAAFLWESGQLRAPISSSDFYVYGELTLSGEVMEPESLRQFFPKPHNIVLTGKSEIPVPSRFRRQVISHLKDLAAPQEMQATLGVDRPKRPTEVLLQNYSRKQARLLEILATGEHSALLAGAAGSGKSTVVQSVSGFLQAPSELEFQELKKIHSEFGQSLQWRPVVKPHHSTPTMSMVGGGHVPYAGEISRAHGGVLILDELLEFSPAVQEALREPFEEGKMRVFRNGKLKEYPAQAQILSTTNLCPCGSFVPGLLRTCGFSNHRCKSYGPRLSGPLVDRFEILSFSESIGDLEVSGSQILKRVEKAHKFSRDSRNTSVKNSRLSAQETLSALKPSQLQLFGLEVDFSQRRKVALIRVARTLADLDASLEIESQHIKEAVGLCRTPFEQLKRWD